MHERTKKKKVEMRQGDGSNVDKSDWLSRDVSKISSKVEDRLNETTVDVSNHFLKTLTKYNPDCIFIYLTKMLTCVG